MSLGVIEMSDVPVSMDSEVVDHLAKVFFPFTHREAARVYSAGQSGKFAHYTSAETALKIIGEKRIWMRNTTCMADYREVLHGHDMLIACFNNGSRDKFRAALDECRNGVADDAISLFDKNWHDTRLNTFVACVSEHDEKTEDHCGRLSMWRAFAPNTTRVALIFSIPGDSQAARKLSLTFAPVAYFSQAKMQEQLDEVIANIHAERKFISEVSVELLRGLIFTTLLASHVSVKHEGFHEEREWRAIYGPLRWPSEIMIRLMSIKAPSGVPQRIYEIPLDVAVDADLAELDFARIFHRLIIGPSPYGTAMEDAFIRELQRAGVDDAHQRVIRSDIPIRSLM